MTLINKIIRRFPKKQITAKELDRKYEHLTMPFKGTIGGEPDTILRKEPEKTAAYEEEEIEEEEYEVIEREILPEKIICPDCGGITLQGLEYCDKCGGELNSQ
ncbi:MAG: hypothetical protein E7256_07380 [Lachnospiraceae bacterium]|nr:hypothetical protein [Lachnospiraceae bacterium]